MSTEDQVYEQSHGRRESFEEKLDRNWNELLQELRVMQTGAQIITAFLMTLPFQNRFGDLEDYQVGCYIGLLVLSALISCLIMTPVAVHRKLFGLHVKDSTVAQGHRMVKAAVLGIGVLLTGSVAFIVDVAASGELALGIGGAVLAIMLGLLWILPRILKRTAGSRNPDPGTRPGSRAGS